MSGTFSSFGSALSALRYNRVAMDVASSNVANANTAGYTRRVAVAQATGAPAAPAVWSTWNGTAGGVEVGGVERMVDALLNRRSRLEQAALSHLDTRAASLVRFETTIGEPGEGGVAAALSAFKQGWGDVVNNPGDLAARSQLLGRAETLVSAIRTQADAVATEWADQRARLDAVVTEVNTLAADLARLNGALRSAYVAGTDANTLLDQRDQLTLRLAELTGATATESLDTTVDLTVAGIPLVVGTGAGTLTASGGSLQPPTAPSLAIQQPDGVTSPVSPVSGEIRGTLQVLTEDLPAYLGRLNGFVTELVGSVNTAYGDAVDLAGNPAGAFFTGTTVADLAVAVASPGQVGAAHKDRGGLDASVADAISTLDMGASTYRSLVTDFGVQVASARRVADNQGILTAQVDASRESLSGVNIDEEMVNLLAAQRAYEGASRVLTTLDSVLDTLINRTGLTR